MLDSKQLKSKGLSFARSLHIPIKTAVLFTVEHKTMERPIQQSFQFLNNMLKEGGQFTFGFVDNQVMLNNLLTTDDTLQQLEAEFLKRGITAVTFEPGFTLGRYRKVIGLLAAPIKTIDAAGGVSAFLDKNELEGARILLAPRNQKDKHADTIIETDSEAYITSRQTTEDQGPRNLLDSIDALLESAWFDPSTRAEVLSDFAARGVDGTGYGVPIEMSSLVVLKDGEAVGPKSEDAPQGGGGTGEPRAGVPAGNGGGIGGGPGDPTTGMGPALGAGQGVGFPAGGHPGVGSGGAGRRPGLGGHFKGGPWTSNSGSFMELVEASVQRSLLEEQGNPQKSYASLARILRTTGVDKILDHFPAERRQELTTLAPEQLAAE